MVLLTVFIFVLVAGLVAEKIAPALGLLAYPDQHRRHKEPTPIVGGISIVIGLLLTDALFDLQLNTLLPAIALIFVVGVIDDRFKLPSGVRFIAQAISVWLLIEGSGVVLNSLGAIQFEESVMLGNWAVPMTIFAGIGVINAINMSDGMDGLLGSLVCLILLAIILLASPTEPWVLAVIAAVCAFLCLNLRIGRTQARVFLGDAGSTLLGLLICYLLVKHSQGSDRAFAPVTALWLMALPLIDAVAVLLVRPLRGSSPFSADRIHYHHLLQNQGFSVSQSLLIVMLLQALAIGLGVGMLYAQIAEYIQLWFFLAIFLSYICCLWIVTKHASDTNTVDPSAK